MFRVKPDPKSLTVGALLTGLVALGQISTSTYIPSLPFLVEALDTDAGRVNLTLSLFLAGFAISQLIYGPLSDRYGRRPILIGGLVLYLAASLYCAYAGTIEELIMGRIAQGVGACSGAVLGRAIVRDVYGPDRAAKALAYIGVAFALSPAVTPIIGGYLQVWFGWRANFFFFTAVAVVVLALTWIMLDETNEDPDPGAINVAAMVRTYAMLLGSPVYVGYMLSLSLIFAGLMAYTAAAPFLFIDVLGMSADGFGLLSVINVLGFLAGTLAAGRLTLRLGTQRMAFQGILISLAGAAAMAAVAVAGHMSIAAIIAPMTVFLAGMGIVMPNAMAGAMAPFPRNAGAASALMGFFQMLVAALASALAGWMPKSTQLPMALLMFIMAGLALVGFMAFIRTGRAEKG
ncbi:MAG: multidrug effflux MFS transporter [Rhodospirillales bacterium]